MVTHGLVINLSCFYEKNSKVDMLAWSNCRFVAVEIVSSFVTMYLFTQMQMLGEDLESSLII